MSMNGKTCWVVVEDGLIGTENQCIGVALALGIKPIMKRITMKWPWTLLSPHISNHSSAKMYTPDCLKPPYPDLVIAAGRKSIAASRFIKQASGGKTFVVQLQNPKISASEFDLVAIPHHDTLRGDNVIVTDGAPNRITPRLLARAKNRFTPLFEPLKPQRIAVIVGGKSKTHSLTTIHTQNMIEDLQKLDGSLMITASRRTGDDNIKLLKNAFDTDDHYFWNGSKPNPYWGILAWADHILVTEDSVSMISDAGSTGKPVHIIDIAGGSARFDRFKDHMKARGVTRDFTGNLSAWDYEPLRDAHKVADAIEKAMK